MQVNEQYQSIVHVKEISGTEIILDGINKLPAGGIEYTVATSSESAVQYENTPANGLEKPAEYEKLTNDYFKDRHLYNVFK